MLPPDPSALNERGRTEKAYRLGRTTVDVVVELFEGLGSVGSPLTVALFAAVPARLGFTTSVIVAVAPLASVPIEQVTGPLPEHEPCVLLTEENGTPDGSVSDSLMPDASSGEGPVFVTVSV